MVWQVFGGGKLLREKLEALGAEWSTAAHKGDHLKGIQIAARGLLEAHSEGDREYTLMFLGMIRHAADAFGALASGDRQKSDLPDCCSFCLRQMPLFVRGTGVIICSECIEEARSSLDTKR